MPSRTEYIDGNDAITVPIIEIADGWTVDDIENEDDCDDAFSYLMAAVAEIEYQIDMDDAKPAPQQRPEWKCGAKRALKYKRAALQLVGFKRGRINDARNVARQAEKDRRLLEFIRGAVANDTFVSWVVAAGMV